MGSAAESLNDKSPQPLINFTKGQKWEGGQPLKKTGVKGWKCKHLSRQAGYSDRLVFHKGGKGEGIGR